MRKKTRVILVTDGDKVAQRVVEYIATELGLRCISASGGNPTPISGQEIVQLLQTVPYDPVLVMFDDRGRLYKGLGETAMEYVAAHPDIQVIGAIAVASNTDGVDGVIVDDCINSTGSIIHSGVNKAGTIKTGAVNKKPLIEGDTVDVLNYFNIPVIIGIGDIGKMNYADDITIGAPITRKAIEEILKRNGLSMN